MRTIYRQYIIDSFIDCIHFFHQGSARFQIMAEVDGDKVTLFLVILVAAAIMLANAFGTLSPLEYGFVQRWPSNQLDRTRVYKSGRYFLGLGNSFVVFPATAQKIDFVGSDQISAATKDQLSVGIDLTVYYKLKNTESGEWLLQGLRNGYRGSLLVTA